MNGRLLFGGLVAAGSMALVAAGQLTSVAQTPAVASAAAANDEAGLKAAMQSYSASLKSGDLKAILATWAEDAEFTDEDGTVAKGHAGIGKLYEANLEGLKNGKSSIRVVKLRFLTPDVATMEGAIEYTPANGIPESNLFSAVWAKKDGRWLIATARDLPEPAAETADRALKDLQWAFGEWKAEDRGTTIKLTIKPALGGKFAVMDYEIKKGDETTHVMQFLGWDPVEASLRSWVFDSRGGFGEGLWARDNATWVGETVGVLPTGQVGSAVSLIRAADPNTFLWQSTNREVEGQPIPDSEIKYTRVNPKP